MDFSPSLSPVASASPAARRRPEPLHDAARAGEAGEVRRLVAEGAPVNARDEIRETPLIEAALADQAECSGGADRGRSRHRSAQ